MGYRPLSHAQAIRTGRVRALGLVVQIDDHDSQRPFLADFLAGISVAASAEGWTLTVATADSEARTVCTMAQLVEDRKADGFMRDAVVHLARLGHRRIAFVNGGARYNYSRLRLAGYRAGLAAAGLEEDPALIRGDALRTEDGARETRALLELDAPPTAVVFAVDHAALGLYRVCADLGLAVGRDLSVISYDGVPDGAYADPPLSSFKVDTRAAGQRLAEMLIARIRGAAPEELRETAPAIFDDRGSAGPPRLEPEALARRLRQETT
jgi:LacI family transcriptional regulator